MLLNLVVLLSSTMLTLAAPTDKEIPTVTTANVEENSAGLEEKSIASKDPVIDVSKASTIEANEKKELNTVENPIIKEILDKLDKSDITEVINEEKQSKTKTSVDSLIVSEVTKVEGTVRTPTEDETTDSKNKLATTMVQTKDDDEYIKKITEETDKQLKDVASAVAEVVTSLPVPLKPDDTNSAFSDIVRKFISDLLKIPMILLHAVSSAVATITNNKVNLSTPTYLTIQAPSRPSSQAL